MAQENEQYESTNVPVPDVTSENESTHTESVELSKEHELYEEHEEEKEIAQFHPAEPTKKQKALQIALGWIFGFLVWLCLALSAINPGNELMNWLFLLPFVGAMLTRAKLERTIGVSVRPFNIHLIFSLLVFLGLFIILGPVTHVLDGFVEA